MTESLFFSAAYQRKPEKRNWICIKHTKKQQKLWTNFKFREKPVDFTGMQEL